MTSTVVTDHRAGCVALLLIGLLTAALHGQLAMTGHAVEIAHGKSLEFVLATLAAHPAVLGFLLAESAVIAGLHAVLFALTCWLGRARRPAQRWHETSAAGYLFTWLALGWGLVRINSALFPHSTWTWAFLPLTSNPAIPAVDGLAAIWLSLKLWSLGRHLVSRLRGLQSQWRLACSGSAALAIGVIMLASSAFPTTRAPASPGSPNVVIIGLDSLQRAIALETEQPLMPELAEFREHAWVAGNVVSPLPHTFPAWVTILTGMHPSLNGARFNLIQQDRIQREASMAFAFASRGYRTIYATDETRFSNIGHDFGFDEIVAPEAGVADYLLGQFSDQPVVNLAIQIPYIERLLPALVGNRAFAAAYRPARFVNRLVDSIGPAESGPTFLAVHLCLAHWPYFSADTPIDDAGPSADPYRRSVRELDRQFALLTARLRELGYINDRSIVVVLADHGEGTDPLAVAPLDVITHEAGFDAKPPPGGHGATLLDPVQWQVFMMFSGHTSAGDAIEPGLSNALASLEDLAPTVLRLAGIEPQLPLVLDVPSGSKAAAASVAPVARSQVVIETGFRPPDFNPTRPDGDAALKIAQSSYRILDDGRIVMKSSVVATALLDKDVGVTDGHRSLLLLNQKGRRYLVSQDLAERRWEVFPTEPASDLVSPPLLDSACRVPDMRAQLPAWCARLDSSRPDASGS